MTSKKFAQMFEGPMPERHETFVIIDFRAPDGHIFTSTYDMAADLDLRIINKNIQDGYDVLSLTACQNRGGGQDIAA